MIVFGIFFAVWIYISGNRESNLEYEFSVIKCLGLGAIPIALVLVNLQSPKRRGLIYGMRTLDANHFKSVLKAIDCRIVLFFLFNISVINSLTVLRMRVYDVFKVRSKEVGPVVVWMITDALTMTFFIATA